MLPLLGICRTASFGEEISYHRLIVRLDYPADVREDFSVAVAGRRIRWGLEREMPLRYGVLQPYAAYDNGNPIPLSVERTETSVVAILGAGDGCLPVGRHRFTLMYRLYPRLRGDTLILNLRPPSLDLPTDFLEVVLILPEGIPSDSIRIIGGNFNVSEAEALSVLRLTAYAPDDDAEDLVLRLPYRRRESPALLLLLIPLLLHAAGFHRRRR
ncbi:MAG: hypothetical protein GXO29_00760 [Thermotogae bacterium]|nr:hypothetical protein [Thermotogota bacterium]